MSDFKTIQQKISDANKEFSNLCRDNNDWVTSDQAEMILKNIGFQSCAKMNVLLGEADSDGFTQIKWENLRKIINALTDDNHTNEDDNMDEENNNDESALFDLPDDEEKHAQNALDFAFEIIEFGKSTGGVINEKIQQLAEKYQIKKN